MMWARVKGRTENALLAMPFRGVHVPPRLYPAAARRASPRPRGTDGSMPGCPGSIRCCGGWCQTTSRPPRTWAARCWRSRPENGPANASSIARKSTMRRLCGLKLAVGDGNGKHWHWSYGAGRARPPGRRLWLENRRERQRESTRWHLVLWPESIFRWQRAVERILAEPDPELPDTAHVGIVGGASE